MSTAATSIAKAPPADPSDQRDRALVIAAVAVALLARVVAMFVLGAWHLNLADKYGNFTFGYEAGSVAYSLVSGHGFGSPFLEHLTGPTAWLAPVYPTLLAGIFLVFGAFTPAAAIAAFTMNSVFSALICFPIYYAGKRTMGRGVALWAVWIWALCPLFWRWAITWIWEMDLSALLFACAFCFALRLRAGAERKHWIAFGAFWGLCALSNPSLLTFSMISALWAAWPQLRSLRGWLRTAVLAGIVALVTISPWLVRNRMALGHWSFIRDDFGFELSLGNYHGSNARAWSGMFPAENPRIMRQYISQGEASFVARHGALARQFIRQYPREFAQLCLQRVLLFWNGYVTLNTDVNIPWWRPWMFWQLSALALLGAVFALSRRVPAAWMYALAIFVYPIPYYLTYPQLRYRHPIEPLMLLLGVYLLQQLWFELRPRRTPRSTG